MTASTELTKALAKGSIQLAPRKEEKLAASVFTNLTSKKSKRTKKGANTDPNENSVDFQIIKKFNNLHLAVPMK